MIQLLDHLNLRLTRVDRQILLLLLSILLLALFVLAAGAPCTVPPG